MAMMPAALHRLRRLRPVRPRRRIATQVVLASAIAVFIVLPIQASAAGSFEYDTYFTSAYERQVDSRTCVAASTAMMMNILGGRDLNMNQMTILRYAQTHDALNDATQRGSDPLGWANAATKFSQYTIRPTLYRWEAYDSESAALRRAAVQITRYGKAVGLLVQHGGHAVVMNGFTATHNPLTGSFKLTGVWVSDPYGARNTYYSASGSPLDKYLQLDATTTYDKAWYGKYIVIVPRN
jgi:peptidase C39-like protein